MIIYNPHNQIMKERISQAEEILDQLPVKHCFITGSFLYKERYQDIDVFVISRTKKKFKIKNKKIKITILDFNDLYSLFYHSISKSCIAKTILPIKSLKVTFADFWQVINEAVPTILNQKNKYQRDIRFLILYTEYFKTGDVFDTFHLNQKISSFRSYSSILEYIETNIPNIVKNKLKKSYLQRFFYTQAGFYKELIHYPAQKFLYNLTHLIVAR